MSTARAGRRRAVRASMMRGALGGWLAPAGWLAVSSLMVADSRQGLWAGLLLVLAPLAALSIHSAGGERAPGGRPSAFVGAVASAVGGMLLWANLALAGDIASVLGAPRWEGVALATSGSVLVAAWPGQGRMRAMGAGLSVGGLVLSLAVMLLVSGRGPLDAWDTVASREALRFGANSPSVIEGRVLGPLRTPVVFDEEHRVTAPDGAVFRVVMRDGDRVSERSVTLAPGQSLTLRPGDALVADTAVRLRFEARRRVPGAPPSGIAWADGHDGGGAVRLGLAVTLLGGAIGLMAGGGGSRPSRVAVGAAGAGLLGAFLWAQGWAVYSLLLAPEMFLGGVTPARLIELPMLALGAGAAARVTLIVTLVSVGVGVMGAAGGWLDRGGAARDPVPARSGRDLAVRGVLVVGAGLASLWPVEPWTLMLLALGAGGSALAPAALSPGAPGRAELLAGALGLAAFVVVGAAGWLLAPRGDIVAALARFPALAALPVALTALALGRRISG